MGQDWGRSGTLQTRTKYSYSSNEIAVRSGLWSQWQEFAQADEQWWPMHCLQPQIPVQPVVRNDWCPLPWKSLLPWESLGKGGIKALQTAQGPKPSPSPKPVTACPPLEPWLSATDAAEGGAQLPNTLTKGMGTPGPAAELSHTPGASALASPVPLLRSPYGGTIERGKAPKSI